MFQKKITLILAFILLLSLTFNLFFLFNKNYSVLDNPEKMGNYSLGYRFIRDHINQGTKLDIKALSQGMQDAVDNKKTYTNAELEKFEIVLRDLSTSAMNTIIERNKKIAIEFMMQNKSRDGVQTTSSGLQYRVLADGQASGTPKQKNIATISYEIKFLSGEVFEASTKQGDWLDVPLVNLPLAMQEAIQKMNSGAHWIVYAPPELAYGAVARPGIPPNSVLIIDIRMK